jgi:hypothetical protein
MDRAFAHSVRNGSVVDAAVPDGHGNDVHADRSGVDPRWNLIEAGRFESFSATWSHLSTSATPHETPPQAARLGVSSPTRVD